MPLKRRDINLGMFLQHRFVNHPEEVVSSSRELHISRTFNHGRRKRGAGEGHGPPLSLREKHKNILNIKKKKNTEMKKKKKDFNSLGFQNVSKGMLNCKQYRFLNWVCTCNELAFTIIFIY